MDSVFQSLASGHGIPNSKSYVVQFRAGLMVRDGNMLKPDSRKGLVYLDISDDALLHFCWKDRSTNHVELDLLIFPEEAEFKRVEQSKDRVFMLSFKSSSQKHFFWMQEPKSDKDQDICEKINKTIDDPSSAAQATSQNSPNGQGAEQEQLLRILQESMMGTGQPRSSSPGRRGPTSPQNATGATPEQMQQLRNLLAGIQVPQGEPDVDLTSVLNMDNLRNVLNNAQSREALFPHLPPGSPRTREELDATIRSPQFRQSLNALSFALRSGHLSTILSSMGLDLSNAGNAQGVEALIRAVLNRHRPQSDDPSHEDRMDLS